MRRATRLRRCAAASLALASVLAATTAAAQDPASDAALLREMRRQMQEMQQRINELEARLPPANAPRATPAEARPARAGPPPMSADTRAARQAAEQARAAAEAAQAAQRVVEQARQPVAVRAEVDESLRGSFNGAFRVPGTDTSVRLYGIVKLDAWGDFSARNRSDSVTAQGIPLNPSTASLQGGDIQATARRTRFGFESRTPTEWGELATQVEMDFAGGNPSPSGQATSSGYQPRLRLAYARLGGFLAGQYNSLWNDDSLYLNPGLFRELSVQGLDNGTILGTSGVRQAQVRYTGTIAENLTLAVSVETPYSDFTTSANGALYPDSSPNIAFNTFPDLLARLRYQNEWGLFALKGLVRQIEANNNAPNVSDTDSVIGWGVGGVASVRSFGRDFLTAQVNYGSGIGRYLDSTSNGQGGVLNQPTKGSPQLDTVDVFSVSVGYQHRWADTVRSNLSYSYANLNYPAFARQFSPTGAGAPLLNRDMQQAFVNLVWSPVPRLDLGIEYLFTTRDLLSPISSSGLIANQGTSSRLFLSMIARF